MPITMLQSSVCATYSYYEGRNKVVITNNKLHKAEGFNIVDDIREQTNIAGTIQDWSAFVERARQWRKGIFDEFSSYCKGA
jgi:hypothetical protein